MNTIIVTGCAGLLGASFSRHLLAGGYKVVGIDDLSGGYQDYLPEHNNFEFHLFDLSCANSFHKLDAIFSSQKPIACYHFAAYAAEGLSPFIRHYNYKNNVLASINIVNACINYNCKMIFTSSMAVYGNNNAPFIESMLPEPIDPYGIAKYAVEQDIRIAGVQHGLKYNIIRPHNVIGIYQNIWDRYRNVAGIFIRRVLAGQPILIYGDGNQTRAFSDIRYYMEPFEKLIDGFNGHLFNLGADQSYSINYLADTVSKIADTHGYGSIVHHVEPRHEVKHAYCDHSKAKDLLNFHDDTDLETLLDQMFVWAISQPKRESKKMQYEIEVGLYEYWK